MSEINCWKKSLKFLVSLYSMSNDVKSGYAVALYTQLSYAVAYNIPSRCGSWTLPLGNPEPIILILVGTQAPYC